MIQKDFVIPNKLGMHARSAALFVQTTEKFKSEVLISKAGGREVNGKSVMGLMLLAAECGSTVRVRITGPDEKEALEALNGLFRRKFDED
jgi:phosphocarrier protein